MPISDYSLACLIATNLPRSVLPYRNVPQLAIGADPLDAEHAPIEQPFNRDVSRKWADSGVPCSVWYERDPWLDPLRQDRAFKDLVADLAGRRAAAAARFASR